MSKIGQKIVELLEQGYTMDEITQLRGVEQ